MPPPPAVTEELAAHAHWLRRMVRGMVRDDQVAEDLVQDALEAGLRFGGGEIRNSRAWLLAVARKLHLKQVRSDGRRARREAAAPTRREEDSAADLVERVEAQREIAKAVLSLPDPYRSVLLMRFFEDLPVRRIAARRGESSATISNQVRRGLRLLRAKMPESLGGNWALTLLPLAAPKWWSAPLAGSAPPMIMSTKKTMTVAAVLVGLVAGWILLDSSPEGLSGTGEASTVHAAPSEGVQKTEPLAAQGGADRGVVARASASAGRLVGRVVDASTGEPVPGASVRHSESGESFLAADFVELASADGMGEFAVDLVDGVPEEVCVHADGYLDAWVPLPASADAAGIVQVPEARLMRGPAVRGRVLSASGGRPIAGARIAFLPPRGAGGPRSSWGVSGAHPSAGDTLAVSAGDGSFEISCGIALRDGGGGLLTLLAFAEDGVGWATLAVVPGREALSDIEILLQTSGALRVQVVGDDGEPVEGARVTVQPLCPPWPHVNPDYLLPGNVLGFQAEAADAYRERFLGVSDEAGVVAFSDLPIDDCERARYGGCGYGIVAVAEGYDVGVVHAGIEAGSVHGVTLVLPPGVDDAISGTVIDEFGAPIPGARVSMTQTDLVTTSERDGSFRLELGLERPGRLICSAAGYADFTTDLSDPRWGGRRSGIEVVMLAGAVVRGRLIDTEYQPIEGVAMTLVQGATYAYAVSQEDGGFEIRGARGEAGELLVRPHPADYVGARVAVEEYPGELVVQLEEAPRGHARLVAELVDYATGKSVDAGRAYVHQLVPGMQPYRRVHLQPGRILVDGLVSGDYELVVSSPGYGEQRLAFAVEASEDEVHLRIPMLPPGSVIGSIAWTGGVRPADLRVELEQVAGFQGEPLPGRGPRYEWPLLEDGTFRQSDLPVGKWKARVVGEGVQSTPLTFEVTAGGQEVCNLTAGR